MDCMQEESVVGMESIAPETARVMSGCGASSSASSNGSSSGNGSRHDSLNKTLVCFVLVDPNSKHAFCSRYDHGPWPLLQGISQLPPNALQMLRTSRAVFTNGARGTFACH